MKFKKQMIKTSLLAFGLLMGVGLIGIPSIFASPVHIEKVQNVLNFDHDRKKVDEYRKTHLKPFFDSLSHYEKNLAAYYMGMGWHVNRYLSEGKLFKKDEKVSNQFYDLNFNEIGMFSLHFNEYENAQYYRDFDQIFKKEDARLPDSMMVYRRVDEKEFTESLILSAFTKEKYAENINREAFQNFKKDFEHKKITNVGYTSTSLSRDYHSQFIDRPILIELSVPKGTSAFHIPNCYAELVLPRNTSYQIDEISIFKEDKKNLARKEGVKVKAHLVMN